MYFGDQLLLYGVRHVNMYFLRDNVIEGEAMIPSATENEQDMARTQLWHMRLRHVGESGLRTLSKCGLFGRDKYAKIDFYEHCVYDKQCRVTSTAQVT